MKRQTRRNFALGRLPEAREKATVKLRLLGASEDWRTRVGEATRRKMHDPEIRARHLAGLKRSRSRNGVNFKGGNGQPPTGAENQAARILVPLGFITQLPIKTRGHRTNFSAAMAYKVDFGNPLTKLAIELDGPCHRLRRQRAKDLKKNAILASLGWTVERFRHSRSDAFLLTSKDSARLSRLLGL